ncbi:hypothetical protein AKJ65_07700 [candidate division MSBL1 archaeon SCGC-AAA259E19]|uniref:Uncharacterized protein n=1 Tax=candidate division MSBL1 archaeon SCGC-AAA259E19 TaxID=1698264 RepID=A0A133UDP4_9EURY|nr:hypothetical protein AKJ65_07700 [candidate division MSBL1 archaeon SCGC-AAA259E19]
MPTYFISPTTAETAWLDLTLPARGPTYKQNKKKNGKKNGILFTPTETRIAVPIPRARNGPARRPQVHRGSGTAWKNPAPKRYPPHRTTRGEKLREGP